MADNSPSKSRLELELEAGRVALQAHKGTEKIVAENDAELDESNPQGYSVDGAATTFNYAGPSEVPSYKAIYQRDVEPGEKALDGVPYEKVTASAPAIDLVDPVEIAVDQELTTANSVPEITGGDAEYDASTQPPADAGEIPEKPIDAKAAEAAAAEKAKPRKAPTK